MNKPKQTGFKIRCHYRMADLESTQVFETKEAASAALRQWKKDAQKQGLRLVGSVRTNTQAQ
jgi:hypothetical protein